MTAIFTLLASKFSLQFFEIFQNELFTRKLKVFFKQFFTQLYSLNIIYIQYTLLYTIIKFQNPLIVFPPRGINCFRIDWNLVYPTVLQNVKYVNCNLLLIPPQKKTTPRFFLFNLLIFFIIQPMKNSSTLKIYKVLQPYFMVETISK